MRASRQNLSPTEVLSDDLRSMLQRRLTELAGLTLLILAGLGALAFATWSVTDPSLNHATVGPVRNWLGLGGAALSDFMMQMFGLGVIALLMPLAFWGWRLIVRKSVAREKLRLAAWISAIAFSSAFAACLPATMRWPLPTGLGGSVGDWMVSLPAFFMGQHWAGRLLLVLLLASLAAGFLVVACGFLFQESMEEARRSSPPIRLSDDRDEPVDRLMEERDESSLAVRLGAVLHGFLSLKHRLARRFAHRPPQDPSDPLFERHIERAVPAMRREPSFDSAALPLRTRPPEVARHPDEAIALDEPKEARLISAAEAAERDFVPSHAARVIPPAPSPKPGKRISRDSQPDFAFEAQWEFPPVQLLAEPKKLSGTAVSQDALEQNARLLEGVLEDFGVRGEIVQVRPGPVVTLYELEPAPGIKSSRVIGLADDIARSMSAVSARVAVVPGRNAIGIELPNSKRETVYFRELIASQDFEQSKFKLALCLGKTIGGEPVIAELAKMPHLLVAGTTGSGKSVAINTMILSLLYRLKPEECRLIMVDPKMLELSIYDGIPHLLTPVVTDPKKAVVALKWAVREMEERYKKMSKLGVRNIDGYNQRAEEAQKTGEAMTRTVQTGFDRHTAEALYDQEVIELKPMPYIVVIVDEMADLMMVAGKDIEGAIQRLAQMARAAGIHLIMATQRPSVDVITGTIKANFPTRISFQVTSKIDSRTILGEQGAEQLLGQGDMLHMVGGGRISRVHGPFVSDDEVEKVVAHLKAQGRPDYLDAVTAEEDEEADTDEDGGAIFDKGAFGEEGGDLYDQAVKVVLRDKKCSTSYIQRRLGIGYNRAASLVERMEKEGLVGAANHAGKREILVYSRDHRAAGMEEEFEDA